MNAHYVNTNTHTKKFILLCYGLLGLIPQLCLEVADKLKGERSSTGVPLHRLHTQAGQTGQRNGALCCLHATKQETRRDVDEVLRIPSPTGHS